MLPLAACVIFVKGDVLKRLFLSLLLLVMSLALVAVQTTPTPEPTQIPPYSVVVGADIYVRGGPGRQYPPVGQLVLGEIVRAVSRNADGDWVLIIYHSGLVGCGVIWLSGSRTSTRCQ